MSCKAVENISSVTYETQVFDACPAKRVYAYPFLTSSGCYALVYRGPAGKSVEFSHFEHNYLNYEDLIDKQLKCHGFDLLGQI